MYTQETFNLVKNQIKTYNKKGWQFKVGYIEKYVPTTDYLWCPPYEDNIVKVCLGIFFYSNKIGSDCVVRIYARGADDTGYIKEFCSNNPYEVLEKYDKFLNFYNKIPNNVSVAYFEKNGFTHW